jgi:hypothetical protein
MSKITLIYAFLFIGIFLNSQSLSLRENIKKITEICYTHDYYKSQVKLWKEKLDQNYKDEDAWFNYYKANRYSFITSESDTNYSNKRFQCLKTIIDDMEKSIPNTYTFHICKYGNSGMDLNMFPHLEKAHKLRPYELDPIINLVTYNEMQGDTSNRNIYAKKWFETGEVSPGMLNYNYNVLQTLKPNAIILTFGDNDTYPLWILQAIHNHRKDVKVINNTMLYRYEFAKKINKELGIDLPNCEDEYCNSMNTWLDELSKISNKRPIYITLTNKLMDEIDFKYKKKLFLTGLAYEYNEKDVDNIALLKKNIDKKFALDYLKVSFAKDNSIGPVKEINTNYIIPFLTLYKHYKESDDNEMASKYKSLIERIMINANREKELKVIFQ